ncbi:aldehyde dehydrogenase [Mycolicibacterium hassiacum DSM 44199]|jgi:aldehyde dehydrogenase (NAD+)|uniref:Aldehyde dehydrogenase n=1 Tax=Mycolicibacterium hassiacum (strain DSM 44199 / CIP 105218 / JCM 12690 / 3849) TaxID=1122247 RepID=K5BDI0_MYCHD|nr:aldehyde dehydrogenase family protein [Mycolicibacterium hassiacum]EKF25870.1 aldehyde dehydrogenase [Mycolicibacterium hassiacum DSM 44199]MBX5486447.1 aldehyde dehydrogenase family protein [Mycolicibacterium hassiacum]MDA4088337.1 aldehyde dehydrogenase [Mycolicibacterium hassiacum DSM 44199]VCT92424.1 Coniferyl aldehyde dehydrogenase [Mycolicibacterium hassiacum DSM 44199]
MTTESVAPTTTTVDIPAVVRRVRQTFATGRTRSIDWRRRQLQALERLVTENEPAIIEALEKDLGRKPFEAWFADIANLVAETRDAAKNVRKWARRRYRLLERSQLPGRGWIEYEPYGVVLIIGAWNFPFVLTLGPAIGAIAAGNAVVLKPSEVAPASSALMAELVPRYLDNDAIAVVEGDGAVSQELIEQGFDKVCFTGGTEIGRKVYQAAAPHLTPVILELGGKSPVIVAADADIDIAAKRIAWTKLVNSGQICIAPDYVLADARIRDQLVDKIKAAVGKFTADEPDGKPIVNRRHFDRLTTALAATKGKVVIGGGSDPDKVTIQPTVVVDPDPAEPLMTEEIFGPILPIVTVQSLDDAIGFVNSRPKPLAAYLFTKSRAVKERVVKEVPAGGMVINHLLFHFATSKLPFGGVGPSGIGAYHGRFGFEEFSHAKSVLSKPSRPDLGAFIYPPYTEKAWKLARRLF